MSRRRIVHRVPPGPMQDWCARLLERHDGDVAAAAEACGVDWHTFTRYLEASHQRDPDVVDIDRMLVAEGTTLLEELYPLDEFPPVGDEPYPPSPMTWLIGWLATTNPFATEGAA